MKDNEHVYECINCNEMFYADEPCEESDICDKCKQEYNKRDAAGYLALAHEVSL